MTKKSLVFLLGSLLLCSGISDVQMGMSPHFDHLNPVREIEFSYRENKATENKQLLLCSVCKTIVSKAIAYIGKTITKDEVSRQIDTICKKIKIPGCASFVHKYKIKLINALLSGDNARTICVKLKLCKKMYMQA